LQFNPPEDVYSIVAKMLVELADRMGKNKWRSYSPSWLLSSESSFPIPVFPKSSARTEFSLPLARQLPLETLQTYPPPMMVEGTS
jgi:hypothetical protein